MPMRLRTCSLSMVWLMSIGLLLLVVVGTAHVGVVANRWRRPGGRQGLAVESGLQNRLHAAAAESTNRQRPAAGCFQPLVAVLAAQTHESEAGAVTLLRMRPRTHDLAEQLLRSRAGLASPVQHPAG